MAGEAGQTVQTFEGSPLSAPRRGIIFEGIGTGLNGFVPSSNPPDTNGRVGATQYVQWNNTSFAVFRKDGQLRPFRVGKVQGLRGQGGLTKGCHEDRV